MSLHPSEPEAIGTHTGGRSRHPPLSRPRPTASPRARSSAPARSMRRRRSHPTPARPLPRDRAQRPEGAGRAGLRPLRPLHRDRRRHRPAPGPALDPRGLDRGPRLRRRRPAAPRAPRTTATCPTTASSRPARPTAPCAPPVDGQRATQYEFARAGIVTEEMVYVAHRENLARETAVSRMRPRRSRTARASARRCPRS